MALKEQKNALRRQIAAELQKVSTDEIETQSAAITKKVLQMPVYQQARSIGIFLSMPGREVSTCEIVLDALSNGKSVFVPYLYADQSPKSRKMDMLQLKDKDDFQSLKPDVWNIPSLAEDSVEKRRNALGGMGILRGSSTSDSGGPVLDLIFMPSVAFDQSHRRLGHGKGFYDRYLSKYKDQLDSLSSRRSMPALVGIALRQQLLEPGQDIPADEYDWNVNHVVLADAE